MPVSIASNISSFKAQRELMRGTDALSKVYEHLASGARINRASDDAAGLAVSSTLRANAKIFSKALANINDGISAVNIADGALDGLKQITIRQKELAEQAANGTYSLRQRLALNNEANSLVDEFNRIVQSTTFNSRSLFSGDALVSPLTIQAGVGAGAVLTADTTSGLTRAVGIGTFTGAGPEMQDIGTDHDGAAIAVGDLNGDGIQDIIMATIGTAASGPGSAISTRAFFGNGDGSFGTVQLFSGDVGASGPITCAIADVNGDGRNDVVVNAAMKLVFLNQGGSTFSGAIPVLGSDTVMSGAADFNGDGRADFVFASGSTLQSKFGRATGSFQNGSSLSFGSSITSLDLGDVNGDGILDVAATLVGGQVGIAFGAGNGTFGSVMSFTLAGAADVAAGDLNNDGYADLAVANAAGVQIYLSNGNGSFKAPASALSGVSVSELKLADMNGDGNLDVVAKTGIGVYFQLALGSASGTFRPAASQTFFDLANQFAIGDFDGDGANDVAFTTAAYSDSNEHAVFLQATTNTSTISRLDLLSQASARSALTALDQQFLRISTAQNNLGVVQSRLAVAASNTGATRIALEGAYSRIMDDDVARSTADLTRLQIQQQAAAAVLAQANVQPRLALTLLGTS